ncbi:MAG: hypothetical protein KDC80_08295, partial [Saprospiraceae bacterium]|nr:hypothetical protein [Saprospiraceae bacterium]
LLILFLYCLSLGGMKAQSNEWQIGVGISPTLSMSDPWYLILKKSLNTHITLRAGLGISSKKSRDYNQYIGPPLRRENGDTSMYFFNYNYEKITTRNDYRLFLGLERNFGVQNLRFFTSGNLYFGYLLSEEGLDEGIYYAYNPAPYTQFYDVGTFDRIQTWRGGFILSFGVGYDLFKNTSIAVEAGLNYFRNFEKFERQSFHVFFDDYDFIPPVDNAQFISSDHAPAKHRTYDLLFSLVNLVTLQYHW